jgi:hypothetical protein
MRHAPRLDRGDRAACGITLVSTSTTEDLTAQICPPSSLDCTLTRQADQSDHLQRARGLSPLTAGVTPS